jgi:decaprenylphospho-beta-D-ribofuranose 2-oxidase
MGAKAVTSSSADRDARVGTRQVVRGWGRATGSSSLVVNPSDTQGWQELLDSAGHRGLIPRGAGSGYGDSAQNAGGLVAHTMSGDLSGDASHDLDSATGIVSVGAGVLLADLMRELVPKGWALPVLPGTAHVTVGGAIAADVHGKNHPSAGSFGAHVVDLALLTPALGLVTVGPQRQPELFWATVGGLGLTGVIRGARIQLRPITTGWMRCRDRVAPDLARVLAELSRAHAEGSHAVAWIDGHRGGARLGRGVLSTADHAEVGDLPARRRVRPLAYPAQRSIPVPTLPARGIMTPLAVKAVNVVHVARASLARRPRLRTISAAVHPLDVVRGWPGLYGRRGLVQYQFMVPFGAEQVLESALAQPIRAGCPPTLAVLKRFGAADPAPLSFPGPGWTLALDFAVGPAQLAGLLDRLDTEVAAAHGRVYLVKDSRLRPELLERMYPRLAQWRLTQRLLDPHGRLASDLSRRLRLTG